MTVFAVSFISNSTLLVAQNDVVKESWPIIIEQNPKVDFMPARLSSSRQTNQNKQNLRWTKPRFSQYSGDAYMGASVRFSVISKPA